MITGSHFASSPALVFSRLQDVVCVCVWFCVTNHILPALSFGSCCYGGNSGVYVCVHAFSVCLRGSCLSCLCSLSVLMMDSSYSCRTLLFSLLCPHAPPPTHTHTQTRAHTHPHTQTHTHSRICHLFVFTSIYFLWFSSTLHFFGEK